MVEDIAAIAFEYEQIGPDLPVNLSPRNTVGFPDEGDEFFEVPSSINDMLGPNLTVIIDVALCLVAVQDLALAHREQLVAVGAFVEIIVLFFEQEL